MGNKFFNIIKFVFNKWSFVAIFFSLFSYWLYIQGFSLHPLEQKPYFKLFFISLFFWTGIGHLLRAAPKFLSWFGSFIFSFILILLLISSYVFYFEYKEFLSTGVVLLLRAQPVYFNSYFSQITSSPLIMGGLLILALLLAWLLMSKSKLKKQHRFFSLGLGAVLVLGCNIILNNTFDFHQKQFLPTDIHNFFSIRQGFSTNPRDEKPLNHFIQTMDDALANDPERTWNIVVIVFESFSKEPLSFYGFDNNYTPFLDQWIRTEQEQFVLMDNSISISGATDVSMPAIYTGVGPEEPYEKLIMAPFLWDYAKAKGLKTYYGTSQEQSWKGMEGFVGSHSLDLFVHPRVLGLELVNDIGADDLTVVDSLQKRFSKDTEPFFLFYNTNATHSPYQNSSPYIADFKGIDTRYGKALFITDKVVENIVNMVKKRNEMDNTIFIFTADHGIYTVKRRSRLSSYFKEALDVPMMFRFPTSWKKQNPLAFQNLQINKKELVTNLDIAPTVFDILFPTTADSIYPFSGTSLLESIDTTRTVVCLSTNDTRKWDTEGFGIYKNKESYIFHGNTGVHFYDLSTDPTQQNDLISEIPSSKRAYYDTIVAQNKYLNQVFQRHHKDSKTKQ